MPDPELVHSEPLPFGAVLEIRRDLYPTAPEHTPIGRVLVTRTDCKTPIVIASGAAGRSPEWLRAVGVADTKAEIKAYREATRVPGAVEVMDPAGDHGEFLIRAVATPADLAREEISPDDAPKAVEFDLLPWRAYLEGACYFYRVAYADGTEDSCFGFYGDDEIPFMKDAGRAAFDADRAMAAAVKRCREILPTFEPVALGDLRAIRRAWDDGDPLSDPCETLLSYLEEREGEGYRNANEPDDDGPDMPGGVTP
jgi:hypothetical protein